jgi:hypothetical protein
MMQRLERTGSFLPKGVAYGIGGGPNGVKFVTYADLKAQRVQRQRERLRLLLQQPAYPIRRAAFVWTFYQPGLFGFAYMGWWAYLRMIGERDEQISWDRLGGGDLALQCMKLFPCGVLPFRENFRQWMEAFGREYSRPGRFILQGLAPIWLVQRSTWEYQIEPAKEDASCQR